LLLSFILEFPLALKAAEKDVDPDFCSTISLSYGQTARNVMHSVLQSLEGKPAIQIKTISGGGGADEVILSQHYAARISSSRMHYREASNFVILNQQRRKQPKCFDNIGFRLCLPISIKLIRNEFLIPGRETRASLVFMPIAEGRPVYSYFAQPSYSSFSTLKKIFSSLGKRIAIFQNSFIKTAAPHYYTAGHLDFHGNNIFCNPIVKRCRSVHWSFSLIDCGTMRLSNIHPLTDPTYYTYNAAYFLEQNGYYTSDTRSLIRKFYKAYLNKLNPKVRKYLKDYFPYARDIASREMDYYNNIGFMHYEIPGVRSCADYYDRIHNSVIKELYSRL
jgi:hypothetical protein